MWYFPKKKRQKNSPKEARSCQFPEPGGLPLPLFEEEKSEGDKVKPGGGCAAVYDTLKFPSASYFLGLPLFFFPNKSPLLTGVVVVAVVAVVVVFVFVFVFVFVSVNITVVVVVDDTPRLVLTTAMLLNGADGESVSEFPSDPETVLSLSSIIKQERDTEIYVYIYIDICVCVWWGFSLWFCRRGSERSLNKERESANGARSGRQRRGL